jgi:pilus assembly protein CpaE
MYPLTIGLVIEDPELWVQAHTCLAELPFRIVTEQHDVADIGTFLDRLDRTHPDVVLLDISRRKEPIEGLVSQIRRILGDAMIIALHKTAEPDVILSSFRAGVNEFLFPPLESTLRRSLERRSMESIRKRNTTLAGNSKSAAFFSAKGGCGATTLITSVAAELGRQRLNVLLADLDLDCGIIGFITKTKSAYSILDATKNLDRLDVTTWNTLVSSSLPGVDVLTSPLSLLTQHPTGEQMRQVLDFVRPQYDLILVDLGHGLSRTGMAVLEGIDKVCLVTTLEVPALHQTKQIIQTLLGGGYEKNRIRLVLNRAPKRLDITPGELEKMLGMPIFSMVPDDYAELYETYAEGRMLSPSSELAQHIGKFAAKLMNLDPDQVQKKRFSLFR